MLHPDRTNSAVRRTLQPLIGGRGGGVVLGAGFRHLLLVVGDGCVPGHVLCGALSGEVTEGRGVRLFYDFCHYKGLDRPGGGGARGGAGILDGLQLA